MAERVILSAAIGRYPHTEALHSEQVKSDLLQLNFAQLATPNRAFAPMVREGRFDVCEMAIATFLQAKAYGKPLVLLPIVLAARFQQSALLCRMDSTLSSPADLVGRLVGVRAYSQTTAMWLRGIIADTYGVQAEQARWMTFEDAHVAEYRDPAWVERAPAGADLLGLLYDGTLDAVIVGNEMPNDPRLRTVFADPAAEAEAFWQAHHFVPVNHMLTVHSRVARERPELVRELLRMVQAAGELAPPGANVRHPRSASYAEVRPAVSLALHYSTQQFLLPRPLEEAEVWDEDFAL